MSLKETYQSRKQLIADNLQAKGVSASKNEGLTTLINKINDINVDSIKINLTGNLESENVLTGETLILTAKLTPASTGKTVGLYYNDELVSNMTDVGNGNYELSISLNDIYLGYSVFEARIGDNKSNIVEYHVRKATNIEITEIIGLRYNEDNPDGFVYDGDEITVKGILTDSRKNRLANKTVFGDIQNFDGDECTTDENGEFSLNIVTR